MMKLLIASLAVVQLANAMPAQLPAGVSAAVCPNYPDCFIAHTGPLNPVVPSLPAVPGLAQHQAAEAQVRASQGHLNNFVPGFEHQFAAEQAIRAQQFALSQDVLPDVPGLAQHQAAEAQVLASQGLVPGLIAHSGREAKVRQAEEALIAIQNNQQTQHAFVGLVGPSGVVGPAGLVGPAGPVAFH